ncbi:MAG TPA: hypothetical protein VGC64_03555, partial [Pyrinomonadaceae bacterium]
MNSRYLASALAFSLTLSLVPARAQTPTAPPAPASPATQRKARKELEQKALVLLDEIVKDVQAYKVPENRLRVKAMAASLFWKYDEARARILFKETLAGLTDLLNNQDESEPSTSHMLQGAVQLRREVVQLLASRDARMARDFLRATRHTGPTGGERPGADDGDLQLEYNLATQATESDPKAALEIAEENLSKGYSEELMNTLRSLQVKDHEAAAKLAKEIVAKLRTDKLAAGQEAVSIATNLLQMVLESAGESEGKDAKKTEPLLDEQGIRELMEMNINLALNSPNYSGLLNTLAAMMPQVEKYAPARVAELRRRMAQFKGADKDEEGAGELDNETAAVNWGKYQTIMEKGTAEELLAAAEKAPQGIRESLYQMAAMKLAGKGEVERAREIINSHLPDSPYRKQMLAELEQQTSLNAAEQGRIEQVRKSLASMRTNEERAIALSQISMTLLAKGDKKLARQFLDEAQNMVNYRAKNIRQLGAQVMVAKAYVQLEPARSLAMLEAIVDQLNELLAAAVTLGGFILDEEVMRDDEILLELFTDTLPMVSGFYTSELRALAA